MNLSPQAQAFVNDFFSGIDKTTKGTMSFDPWSETTTYTDGAYTVTEVEAPGFSKRDLKVTYNEYDGFITVLAQTERPTESGTTKKSLKRVIYIGSGVDDKLITTTLEDGVLKVRYKDPSREARVPKKIKID